VLLNAAGRQLLAGLCGASEGVLARTLPSWGQEDAKLPAGEDQVPAAAWRIGGAVAGSAAFGCRLCAARRTGTAERVVRYTPRRERVHVRHGRSLLDADADQPLEHLDVQELPDLVDVLRPLALAAGEKADTCGPPAKAAADPGAHAGPGRPSVPGSRPPHPRRRHHRYPNLGSLSGRTDSHPVLVMEILD
jgi:hypothetical protein